MLHEVYAAIADMGLGRSVADLWLDKFYICAEGHTWLSRSLLEAILARLNKVAICHAHNELLSLLFSIRYGGCLLLSSELRGVSE